jgi:drug/metabolite transporter (DMT)-like permease
LIILNKHRTPLAYFALICGILALSLSALFVRWAQAPGIVTACFRMLIASIFLFPFFLKQSKQVKKSLFRWWYLPLLGGLFTAFDHGFWSTSIEFTQVSNATLFNNLAPLWVALIAIFIWKEKLGKWFWLGLFFTLTGAIVVLGTNLLSRPEFSGGDSLAIISSFFYAAYFLNTQRSRQYLSTISYIWSVTFICGVILLIACLISGYSFIGYTRETYYSFLGAALISQVIGYFSVGYALGHLPASIVSPTMITQPVITALMAIPLAGESLITGQWLGGLITLFGIYLINRSWNIVKSPRKVRVN